MHVHDAINPLAYAVFSMLWRHLISHWESYYYDDAMSATTMQLLRLPDKNKIAFFIHVSGTCIHACMHMCIWYHKI